MKKIILSILTLFTVVCGSAQISIKESFKQMSWDITSLPHSQKRYGNSEPLRNCHFHLPYWYSKIHNDNLWSDWQLNQPMENPYMNESIFRRFTPSNGDYLLGAITTGDMELAIQMLVTATPEGEFIDAIQTAFFFAQHNITPAVFLRQWKISSDMTVTVYQIKPETNRTITTNMPSGFTGNRIDTQYQITPEGKFVKIKEIIYESHQYTLAELSDRKKNIWDGSERINFVTPL